MKSLLEEADTIIAKRNTEKTKVGAFEKGILEIFKATFRDFPVAMELLSSMYGIRIGISDDNFVTRILKESGEGVKYYEQNIGIESANLMQEVTHPSRDGGAIMEEMYCAWAIRFVGIYGYDLYFIPYADTKNSFACVVINPNLSDEDEEWKHFFDRDISRKFAINMIVEFKTRFDDE